MIPQRCLRENSVHQRYSIIVLERLGRKGVVGWKKFVVLCKISLEKKRAFLLFACLLVLVCKPLPFGGMNLGLTRWRYGL